ncbi:unnamed protein product [Phyllotreta striolata]|uniref:CHK kinase-like domain-containing protein n=1 Tax=Phyllotreta striolata TaxID=444603 RepID=A0A9N9XM29_PHYSR|nr:unnamed protein product [Phyllotreta striolata]
MASTAPQPPPLDEGIAELLKKFCSESLDNYQITVRGGNAKGEGFLGEMTFLEVRSKSTGEELHMIVKCVRPSGSEDTKKLMTSSYLTEIRYYTEILPALVDFQKEFSGVRLLDNFPKCFASIKDLGREKLALVNLVKAGYEMHPKPRPFDFPTVVKVFKTYAEFHAASYALKHHRRERFLELSKNLPNNWILINNNSSMMGKFAEHFFGKVKGFLEDEGEDKISKKFDKYVTNSLNVFIESCTYDGPDGVFLHGDCWSNNMMFKYNASREVEHIKLIDFQLGFVAPPVLDLSYSFYAGADQQQLDRLDELLDIYHTELGENLRKYGCDLNDIYPMETLKADWRRHCRFAMIMGLMVWVTKLATDFTDMPTVNELMDGTTDPDDFEDYGIKFDVEEYRKRSLSLVRHMYERDLL